MEAEEESRSLVRSLIEEAKQKALQGGGGLGGRLVRSTARVVLSSAVWRHATPTKGCDVLLSLPPSHPQAAALLTWLIDQVRRKEPRLRLHVRYHQQTDAYGVYLSARWDALLQGAELLRLRKPLRDSAGGGLREFVYDQAEAFAGVHDKTAFLSSQERSLVVRHLLEAIRAKEGGERLRSSDPDHPPLFVIRPGQPIVTALMAKGFLSHLQPIHEQEQLASLRESWVASLSAQPLDRVKDYFGSQIGLYFAWLGHYTVALVVPAGVGAVVWWWGLADGTDLLSDLCFVAFALLNCVWGTVWVESWKRRQAELAFEWGTLGMERDLLEEPRPGFVGELGPSLVTGRLEPQAPQLKRYLLRYLLSWPAVLLCMAVSLNSMMFIFTLQEWTERSFGDSVFLLSWVTFLPKVLLGVVVSVYDEVFMRLAGMLTDLENWRTEEEFEGALVAKIAAFQFVNSFTALFYLAFWVQDMGRLSTQLAALLITRQVIGNVKEAVLPWLKEKLRLSRMSYALTRSMSHSSLAAHAESCQRQAAAHSDALSSPSSSAPSSAQPSPAASTASLAGPSLHGASVSTASLPPASAPPGQAQSPGTETKRLPLPEFQPSGPVLSQAELESLLPSLESPLEDYLEMWVQLGYVLLFSPAFPLAALFALLNNVLEIRVDAFKLCNTLQRPFGRRVQNIGVWAEAMEAMGVVGVMVNCALIGQSGLVQRLWPDISPAGQILLVVGLEHAFLGLKLLLAKAIPDVPGWVTVQLARVEFHRREALKREVGRPPAHPRDQSQGPANGDARTARKYSRRSHSAFKPRGGREPEAPMSLPSQPSSPNSSSSASDKPPQPRLRLNTARSDEL